MLDLARRAAWTRDCETSAQALRPGSRHQALSTEPHPDPPLQSSTPEHPGSAANRPFVPVPQAVLQKCEWPRSRLEGAGAAFVDTSHRRP